MMITQRGRALPLLRCELRISSRGMPDIPDMRDLVNYSAGVPADGIDIPGRERAGDGTAVLLCKRRVDDNAHGCRRYVVIRGWGCEDHEVVAHHLGHGDVVDSDWWHVTLVLGNVSTNRGRRKEWKGLFRKTGRITWSFPRPGLPLVTGSTGDHQTGAPQPRPVHLEIFCVQFQRHPYHVAGDQLFRFGVAGIVELMRALLLRV